MEKLFVLAGKARSGKDTTADFMEKYYNDKKIIRLMYGAGVKVYATFKQSEYNITVNSSENGSVTPSKDKATMGETITLTVSPAEGYELESLTVMAGNEAVTVANNQFTMPASDVTVTATFTINSYDLTIHYLYLDGTQAAPTYTETIEYNTAYSVASPAVTGYTASQDTVMGIMGAEDVIERVIYSVNSYNITYINDLDTFEVVTYDYGDTIDAMSEPEKEDYIFTGWNPAEPITMPDSNMTLYAQWELIPCMAAENLAVANGSLTATSARIASRTRASSRSFFVRTASVFFQVSTTSL